MKILFLSESTASSGGTRQLLLLASALAARGHALTVACRPASVLNALCAGSGIRTENFAFGSGADLASAFRLASFCRRERFDVMQTFHPRAHGAALVAKYLGARPALVVRRGVIFGIPANPVSRFKYSSGKIAALVAVSGAVKEEFLNAGVRREKISVIPPGIDAAPWEKSFAARKELGWAPPFRIGMIAHFAPFKGQDLLLKAAPRVLAEFPGTRFVFIGRGEAEMKALAASAGLSASVEILGPRDDVPALIPTFHIVTAPSRQEGVPNTLIEAQICGVPVVGSDVGGIPEVIAGGSTGLLVPPDDAGALAAALLSLMKTKALAERLAAAGRKEAAGKFSMEAIAGRFEALYRSVSGGRA
jgi:glycosyltransferase involved in cell wall biosynthesis